jgi:hypothetical protein
MVGDRLTAGAAAGLPGLKCVFDEFFPLVFWERTVNYMLVGFRLAGHSDFLFVFQIWLRGPAEVYSRVPCVRAGEAAIL